MHPCVRREGSCSSTEAARVDSSSQQLKGGRLVNRSQCHGKKRRPGASAGAKVSVCSGGSVLRQLWPCVGVAGTFSTETECLLHTDVQRSWSQRLGL